MENNYKFSNVTDRQLKQLGVQALADRPNAAQQYGQSGLTPTQLKLWFDKLATLLSEKINKLHDAINGEEAAKYIGLALGEYKTLDDLISGMQDGSFAESILMLMPNENAPALASLQDIIFAISLSFSELEESLDRLDESKISKVDTTDTYRRAYGVGKGGNQIMLTVSETPVGSAVAAYNESGVLKAAMTPIPGYETMAYPSEVVNMAFINELRKHIGAGVRFSMNPETYVVTFEVLDIEGNTLSSGSLDLPLEDVVIGCTYDETTKRIVITLRNGNKTEIPVEQLVNGLVTEAKHKLDIKAINDKLDTALNAYIVDVYQLLGGDYVDYS